MAGVLPCLGRRGKEVAGACGWYSLEKPGVPGAPSTAPAWVLVTTAVSCGCQE